MRLLHQLVWGPKIIILRSDFKSSKSQLLENFMKSAISQNLPPSKIFQFSKFQIVDFDNIEIWKFQNFAIIVVASMLNSILDSFWLHLGIVLGSFWCPFGSPNRIKLGQKSNLGGNFVSQMFILHKIQFCPGESHIFDPR